MPLFNGPQFYEHIFREGTAYGHIARAHMNSERAESFSIFPMYKQLTNSCFWYTDTVRSTTVHVAFIPLFFLYH